MKITPRPYQLEAVNKIREKFKKHKSVIMCLPTGAGKTVTFSYMCQLVLSKSASGKVLILTDRTELLSQAGGTLSRFGIKPYIINRYTKTVDFSANCYVAMLKTLVNRLKKDPYFLPKISLCIMDEAHEGVFNSIRPYLDAHNIPAVGPTATPLSSNKKTPLNESFDAIVDGPQISELIKKGDLCASKSFIFEKDLSTLKRRSGEYTSQSLMLNYDCENQYLNVIDAYKSRALGKKMLVFNCNIQHSRTMNSYFLKAGLPSKNLDSKSTPEERKDTLHWFKITLGAILNNCGILTKGFDEPTIEVIAMNRATFSLTLFLQIWGRGARPIIGRKNTFIGFDFGNNIYRHGPWEQDRDWVEIFEQNKKPAADGVAAMKTCIKCLSLCYTSHKICKECGYIFPIEKKKDMERMSLVEFQDSIPEKLAKPLRELSLYELMQRADHGGRDGKKYSVYWVVRQLAMRADGYDLLKEFSLIKGYKSGWLHRTCEKYKVIKPFEI